MKPKPANRLIFKKRHKLPISRKEESRVTDLKDNKEML